MRKVNLFKLKKDFYDERQTTIFEFHTIKYRVITFVKTYKNNRGLSERKIKKVMERQGWEVWRSDCLNILKKREIYPNVKKKYEKLMNLLGEKKEYLQYLQHVHHGMPDFICYKRRFKFIECKFEHEQLSKRQRICIGKLQTKGYDVEVLKFASKIRGLNYTKGNKRVVKEIQRTIKFYSK